MSKDLLSQLDPAQKEAVLATDGPVLVLAGAGSGKTRVLTYKVAYLLTQNVKGSEILAITFTNKAANEMKERIYKLVGKVKAEEIPYVGTFHSFCAKVLRIDGKFIGIGPNYSIYDDDDSLSLIKKIMKDLDISTKIFRPTSILNAISSAKGELVGPDEYAQIASTNFGRTVLEVYRFYEKELANLSGLDFDDLLMKTVKLLTLNPTILSKYAGRFRYVLVDEYQDVNTAQYELTKLLASTWGNITVVGDASQAIYSFRGADFRNILNFERDFPNARVFNLEQNYRSTGNILNAANSVILKNTAHPVLKLWTKNTTGERLTIYNAENELDEANFVVDRVMTSGQPFSDFAVLYRTNAQSRTIEEALLHAKIPYRIYGGIRFYERREIKDVVSYLRLIANPKDKVARDRAEKIGKGRLKKFDEMVERLNLSRGPTLRKAQGRTSQADDRVATKLKSPTPVEPVQGRSLKIKPLDLIDKVLDATDYLLVIDDGTEEGLMRVENVKELKSVASEFEDLTTFLENIALMEGKTTPEKSFEGDLKNYVTLMTIHSAKGLEFENVFLIGMEEGLFPHSRSMLDVSQIEEERRLAYVALTRAKKKLYLSYATRRLYFGMTSANMVSRFLVDIPEELISAI